MTEYLFQNFNNLKACDREEAGLIQNQLLRYLVC